VIRRWLTGLVFAGVALFAAWFGRYLWVGFLAFLLWLASSEWRRLGSLDNEFVDVSLLTAGGLFAWVGVSGDVQWIALLPVLLIFPIVPMIHRQEPDRANDLVWTAGGVIWLSLPAALLFLVRVEFGLGYLLVLVGGTVLQDTVALYSGKFFGTDRPFAPGLSPNKTWAGFWGSVAASVAVYAWAGWFFTWPLNLALSLGLLLGVFEQVGDLSISGLKRCQDLDDTGSFFPGHGGVLDRVDGLIFNVALFYPYCFLLESVS
jgi:phosphatidate cytidylyltransferase